MRLSNSVLLDVVDRLSLGKVWLTLGLTCSLTDSENPKPFTLVGLYHRAIELYTFLGSRHLVVSSTPHAIKLPTNGDFEISITHLYFSVAKHFQTVNWGPKFRMISPCPCDPKLFYTFVKILHSYNTIKNSTVWSIWVIHRSCVDRDIWLGVQLSLRVA